MKKILFLWLPLLLLAACEDKKAPEPSKTELLSKNWQMQRFTGNGTAYNVIWRAAEFRTDGTCQFTYSSGNPFNGTWAFNSNETRIIVGREEYTIITLTASQLILEFSDINYKNGTVTYRAEFKPA